METLMKKLLVPMALTLAFALSSHARDTKIMFPLEKAMNTPDFKSKVGDKVKFIFGDSTAAPAGQDKGVTTTNQKTNAFNKSDDAACIWVFTSAMIAISKKAQSEGADAVVGIVSNYKNNEYSSTKDFECHVGTAVAGVALKGKMLKLK
jgi:hypothetical protein